MSARSLRTLLSAFTLLLAAGQPGNIAAQDEATPWVHAIAMHGEPKYEPGFEYLEYVYPYAPHGGTATIAAIGTFDSLNPFILAGDAASFSQGGQRRFFETLTEQTGDEPYSAYCLLCEEMQMPEDRTWVAFRLRDEAQWSDGTPVTVDDVIFSYGIIRDEGHPFYQDYWRDIADVAKADDRTVRFSFGSSAGSRRDLPLVAGQLPVFQKAWWEQRSFGEPTLEAPISSGPYRIVDVQPGTGFAFEKDPDYWGQNLPLNKGRFNLDRIRVVYYGDATAALEAFKAGEYDWRLENSAKKWVTGYDFAAVDEGLVTKENIPHQAVNGMQGFYYNQRREVFQDPLVREALNYAFDFEWANENLFYGQYTRTHSYWDNSPLAAPPGAPTGAMADYLGGQAQLLPEEVFEGNWTPPSTGGTESGLEANLAEGMSLLESAGWMLIESSGKLAKEAGDPLAFEILVNSSVWERIAAPYVDNLARMGVTASIRVVEPARYNELIDSFDYDMTIVNRSMSASPGPEQREYWTCESARRMGSKNVWGLCDPAIDALVENVVLARDRDDLEAATRALDRALQWRFLCVPHWHIGSERIAYWNVLSRPDISPAYGVDLNTWWHTEQLPKAEANRLPQFAAGLLGFVPLALVVVITAAIGVAFAVLSRRRSSFR